MKTARKYVFTLLAGLALAAWIAYTHGVLEQTSIAKVYHILCDAFFVPGVLICCSGLLIFSTNEGTFDMLAYGLQTFASFFKKDMSRKYETFYDYRASRAEKKVSFGFLVICGLVLVAISLVFYYLYSQCQ